jgi:hypothetical protein
MAGSRTLKLSILAETKDLVDGLNKASKSTETFGDKATEFGKKAAVAFAVAGAAALAFGADAVKAAAEDAKAQEVLAETIRATTNATAAQIAGVEEYITQTSIAIGVTDDQLRPAFSRLVRSTQDTEEAQRLLNLALDLSVAAGKPVETVANALGKAYDGNTTALNKLGLGLDANLLKSKDNEAIIKSLETTYGQFAEGAAETAAVKFERIRIATDEAKESIGAALLPVVERLSDYVLTTVVPNLESFINGLTGKGSLTEASKNATDGAFKFGEQVKKVISIVINLKEELGIVAGVFATIFVVSKIAAGIQGTIALIKTLTATYAALRNTALAAAIASRFAANPFLGLAAAAGIAASIYAATKIFDNGDASANAPSTGAIPFASGFGTRDQTAAEKAELAASVAESLAISRKVQNQSNGVTTAQSVAAAASVASTGLTGANISGVNTTNLAGVTAASGTIINVNVSGAIDAEGTARTIVDTLNNSYYRGTGGASSLQIA